MRIIVHKILSLVDFRKAVRPHCTRSSSEIEKLVGCGQFIQHQELAGLHQEEISHWLPQSGGYPAEEQRSCSGPLSVISFSQQGEPFSLISTLETRLSRIMNI